MKRLIFILFTSAAILLVSTTIILYGNNNSTWDNFIKTPNVHNFRLCESQIVQFEKRSELKEQLLNNIEAYNKYLVLIKEGNRYALELGFQIHKIIEPGSTSEDLYVAIGKTIHFMPEYFLSLLDKYNIRKDAIEKILLMYGDEFVDDIDKCIEETKARILSFSKVKNTRLASLNKICISILTEQEQWLLKTKNNNDLVNKVNQILINDPEQALQKIIQNNITDQMSISGILGRDLPNDETRVSKITERIKFIEERVNNKDLLDLKRKCLKILNDEKILLVNSH